MVYTYIGAFSYPIFSGLIVHSEFKVWVHVAKALTLYLPIFEMGSGFMC